MLQEAGSSSVFFEPIVTETKVNCLHVQLDHFVYNKPLCNRSRKSNGIATYCMERPLFVCKIRFPSLFF
jgi:hypothetical protein